MIDKSKFKKYFLYALGEIILVVIGILIAVSLNNWNEERKSIGQLQNSLLALKNDLVQDTLLIKQVYPDILSQYQWNESLRERIAQPGATEDTLIKIARFEFVPNWTEPLVYNMNAFASLSSNELLEKREPILSRDIKRFYNQKATKNGNIERVAAGYRVKVSTYTDQFTFGSTKLHDQGPLIDSLVWKDINYARLAAAFQGISNYKRLLFSDLLKEMDFSLERSRELITKINRYLKVQ